MAYIKAWREKDLAYLKENWPKKSIAEIAVALGRSESAVKNMRYKLGLRDQHSRWTRDDLDYLATHFQDQSDEELALHFGKSISAIQQKRSKMGLLRRGSRRGPNWTQEEDDFLAEHWGSLPVPNLCKSLNRSRNAIINRVRKLGLSPFLESGEHITLSQLIIAMTGSSKSYSYKITSWVKNRGLPVHNKRNNRSTFRIVYLDEFWKWAEKNRSFIDFSKMEPLILGKEPDWVADQRKKDFEARQSYRKDPWTPHEDARLRDYLKQFKYGYAELSELLGRSAGAIQRRIIDLGLKERPIKAECRNPWNDHSFEILADMLRDGYSYGAIGEVLGKSEKAVRGKVYTVYLTESADKVRAMMGNGPWGTGAPVPTVRQALYLSNRRKNVLSDLTKLVTLLAYRRNEQCRLTRNKKLQRKRNIQQQRAWHSSQAQGGEYVTL